MEPSLQRSCTCAFLSRIDFVSFRYRPVRVARETLLRFPDGLRLLTWATLALELLFLPLSLHPIGRLLAWSAMSLLHIAILFVIAFADLTLGMLMIHLFVFDLEWIPKGRVALRFPKMLATSFA